MRNSLVYLGISAFLGTLLLACGPSSSATPDAGNNVPVPDASDPVPDCNAEGATQCLGTTTLQTCTNGSWVDTQSCTAPQICANPQGCVDCVPGANYCVGNDVHSCGNDGTDTGTVETCTNGNQCSDGECVDLCAAAAESRSYIGCEYWAVDLDNAIETTTLSTDGTCANGALLNVEVCVKNGTELQGLCEPNSTCQDAAAVCGAQDVCAFNAQGSPFAVVVSNPQTFSVDVTISIADGSNQIVSVAAGQVAKLFPQQMGFADQSVDGSGIAAKAYKISANAPIVAYQFNPLNNEDVFANDGSLLIPRTTFDDKYYALTWMTLDRTAEVDGAGNPNPRPDWHGYVAVVAWEDGTRVRVTPSGNTRLGDGSFAALTAGTPVEFTLNAFDVLSIESDGTVATPVQDLSGTLVEALDGKSVGVFGGHEAISLITDDSNCCADHIEEMMFPTSTWGKGFAVARSKQRRGENDLLRIMAQEAGTTVSFTPSPAMGTCSTLAAGQFCDVQISVDTEINTNDKPLLIGHYLSSAIQLPLFPFLPADGNGDPSMAIIVPTEQFRADYTFLVPDEYDENFVSVVAGANVTVTLDGNDVTNQLATFGSGSFKGGRVSTTPGQHRVACPGGCGVEVYGYSDAVSYLFAGGLDLTRIVVD